MVLEIDMNSRNNMSKVFNMSSEAGSDQMDRKEWQAEYFFGPLLITHFDIWQTHKMVELVFFKDIFRHQAKKKEKRKKSHFVALKSPLPENP